MPLATPCVYVGIIWPVPHGSLIDTPGTRLFNNPVLRKHKCLSTCMFNMRLHPGRQEVPHHVVIQGHLHSKHPCLFVQVMGLSSNIFLCGAGSNALPRLCVCCSVHNAHAHTGRAKMDDHLRQVGQGFLKVYILLKKQQILSCAVNDDYFCVYKCDYIYYICRTAYLCGTSARKATDEDLDTGC